MSAAFDLPWPPAPLAPPASGVPCTLTLTGLASASVQIWRRRRVTAPSPLPRPGATPRVSIYGDPLPTQTVVVEMPQEIVGLTRDVPYKLLAENLGDSNGADVFGVQTRPWIWWRLVSPGALPAGSSVALTGYLSFDVVLPELGARTPVQMWIANDGVPAYGPSRPGPR